MDCRESNEVVKQSAAAEPPAPLGPKTPVAERENGDFSFGCDSPVTVVKTPPKADCFSGNACRLEDPFSAVDPGSPRTPTESVFDPFAPGPESMVLAPICKKYTDRLKVSFARPLRYDSSLENDNLDSVPDQEIFHSMYELLLEFIVSKHMEEISSMDRDYDKSKTPLGPRLSAVANTCPGAPMKPVAKARNIDLGLCRKLF